MADQPFKFDQHQGLFLPAEFEAPKKWEREYLGTFVDPPLGMTYREELEKAEMERRAMMNPPPIEVRASAAIARGEVLVSSGGKVVARMKNIGYRENEPCSSTCMFHVTHPCEKCGRQWGPKTKKKIMERKDAFWRDE